MCDAGPKLPVRSAYDAMLAGNKRKASEPLARPASAGARGPMNGSKQARPSDERECVTASSTRQACSMAIPRERAYSVAANVP